MVVQLFECSRLRFKKPGKSFKKMAIVDPPTTSSVTCDVNPIRCQPTTTSCASGRCPAGPATCRRCPRSVFSSFSRLFFASSVSSPNIGITAPPIRISLAPVRWPLTWFFGSPCLSGASMRASFAPFISRRSDHAELFR